MFPDYDAISNSLSHRCVTTLENCLAFISWCYSSDFPDRNIRLNRGLSMNVKQRACRFCAPKMRCHYTNVHHLAALWIGSVTLPSLPSMPDASVHCYCPKEPFLICSLAKYEFAANKNNWAGIMKFCVAPITCTNLTVWKGAFKAYEEWGIKMHLQSMFSSSQGNVFIPSQRIIYWCGLTV